MRLPRALCVALALLWGAAELPAANELVKLTNVRLIESAANDGDSFLVQAGERKLHLRLYFVDCPETVVSTDADAKRVREQAGYFGLTNVAEVVALGRAAQKFTAEQLAEPFTVHTSYADAMGRSATQRVYAFITTAAGKDLARELVARGFARVYGMKRAGPNGTAAVEWDQELRDAETKALLGRLGGWKNADPNEIIRQRAALRAEQAQLDDVRRQAASLDAPTGLVDLNTASNRQLQNVPGIGVQLAARIVAGRPYRSVDDLLRVSGIGPKLLFKLRPHVIVTGAVSNVSAP